jgi:two-component system, oxyanion-binding sensor
MTRRLPEHPHLTLGFIALNDCAPLLVAQEKGYFSEEGLRVQLSREASWANIRDKVAVGALDGAHMLAPLPIACTLGLGVPRTHTIVPYAMNLNGSAITVSVELAEALRRTDPNGMASRPRTARPLKQLIEARKAEGLPSLVFAVVFPFSVHNYELRYWLAEAGVDPDRDIRVVVAPPPRMAELLRNGTVDGFCVGEPWNGLAVAEGTGEILAASYEIWRAKPDKVFGVTAAWADENPAGLQALLRSMLRAGAWLADPANRNEAAAILARPGYVGAPAEVIVQSILATPPYAPGEPVGPDKDFTLFFRSAATFPWVSQGQWFLTQMLRWGQVAEPISIRGVAADVYRPDLYRQAAAAVGVSAPLVDEKTEGAHATPWLAEGTLGPISMSPNAFFDGRIFDPARPLDYLAGLPISRVRPSLAALEAAADLQV